MADRNPNTPPSQPPPRDDEPTRRTASPLLWIVLLLALLAFGWFIYSQRAGIDAAPETAPPPPVEIGDGQDAAAERERADDDARRAAREQEARQAREAPARRAGAGPDREATPRVQVEPDYPVAAYRAREEGTVVVGARISADGEPVDVQVVRRSGSRELDRAAVEAVRQWTFEPAVRDQARVASEVQVPVTFRMDR